MKKSKTSQEKTSSVLPEISKKKILDALLKAEQQNKEIDKSTKIDYSRLSERAGS